MTEGTKETQSSKSSKQDSYGILFLSGPSGVGKSTVAKELAQKFNILHFDLDEELEKTSGLPIAQLVEEQGWTEMRHRESQTLQQLIEKLTYVNDGLFFISAKKEELQPKVLISLGGGTVTIPSNLELIRSSGILLTLWAKHDQLLNNLSQRQHQQGWQHPLPLDSSNSLENLLDDRLVTYLKTDLWLEVYQGESPQQISKRALKTWRYYVWALSLNKPIPQWCRPPFNQIVNVTKDLDIKGLLNKKISIENKSSGELGDLPNADVTAKKELLISTKSVKEESLKDSAQTLPYPIFFQTKAEEKLITKFQDEVGESRQGHRKLIFISDDVVARLYTSSLVGHLQSLEINAHLITFPQGEKSKRLRVVEAIVTSLLQLKVDRSDCLVAFGGGVTGDLCGFVASIYLRGISWIQIPSSLLAQVDSSIGAKTAVNHPLGKNLIGSFYRPKWVWIDQYYLQTFPPRQLRSGWVESLKHGLLGDREHFRRVSLLATQLIRFETSEQWLKILEETVAIKAKIVADDEREQNKRVLLNLGHTLGHAIETIFPHFLHGEAVALGISFITEYSHRFHELDEESSQSIFHALNLAALEYDWRKYFTVEVFEKITIDKKKFGDELKLIVLQDIGHAKIELVSLTQFAVKLKELIEGQPLYVNEAE